MYRPRARQRRDGGHEQERARCLEIVNPGRSRAPSCRSWGSTSARRTRRTRCTTCALRLSARPSGDTIAGQGPADAVRTTNSRSNSSRELHAREGAVRRRSRSRPASGSRSTSRSPRPGDYLAFYDFRYADGQKPASTTRSSRVRAAVRVPEPLAVTNRGLLPGQDRSTSTADLRYVDGWEPRESSFRRSSSPRRQRSDKAISRKVAWGRRPRSQVAVRHAA